MVPVLVPMVMFAGCVPEQMVWFDDTAPATGVGFTETVTTAELTAVQTPLVTTAR